MHSNNIREKLVNNIEIVSEIGAHIDLQAKGRNYVGICPFHADSDPSLTVSSEKQIYKCFACGAGGDVVTFYSKFNNISVSAAIEQLAKKYSIALPKRMQTKVLNKQALVLEDINKYYVTALHSTAGGSTALDYLHNRGFTADVINHFHLGFGYEESEKLYEYLLGKIDAEKRYTISDIQAINHFTNERDMFAKRITIPIFSGEQIVGFGARAINDTQVKYLNSKDSKQFQKKTTLFNFEQAIHLTPNKSLILVEGFFDVIKAYQYNFKNTIGLMGVGLSAKHLQLMRKAQIELIYLALDSDRAGREASLKIGKLLIKNGFKIKVIDYKQSKDLDELLTNYGADEFTNMMRNAQNFKMFEAQNLIAKTNLNSIDEKSDVTDQIIAGLSLENDLVIEEVVSLLMSNFNLSRNLLENKLKQDQNNVQSRAVEAVADYGPQTMPNENNHDSIINNDSNIEFMDVYQAIIFRCISSKQNYVECMQLKKRYNRNLGQYELLFNALGQYYNNYSNFDYVTFINQNQQFINQIDNIYNKAVNHDNLSNEYLMTKVSAARWGIFGK